MTKKKKTDYSIKKNLKLKTSCLTFYYHFIKSFGRILQFEKVEELFKLG